MCVCLSVSRIGKEKRQRKREREREREGGGLPAAAITRRLNCKTNRLSDMLGAGRRLCGLEHVPALPRVLFRFCGVVIRTST